jgi:RNA polymerase sigma factor (sigma-70 family)
MAFASSLVLPHRAVGPPRGGDCFAVGGAGVNIAEVYASLLPRLQRIAAGLGLSLPDAEDALQDSHLALWRQRDRLNGPVDAARWLTRVMINRCVLLHRRRRRWRRLLAAWRPRSAPAAETGDEVKAVVRQCLEELPFDERVVLVLRYFCGLDAPEIGELLEIPSATVRSRLRRARLALAERLMAKGVVDYAP